MSSLFGSFHAAASSILESVTPPPIFRLLPTWNKRFGAAVKVLRTTAYAIPRDIKSIRLLTDNGVPTWLPTLPSGVNCRKNVSPKGEWFYPKSAEKYTNFESESDASKLDDEGPPFILYFHGGAFCCCNTATHRGLLMRLADSSRAAIFAVDYRRPPENPFPTPVDDCLSAYGWLLQKVPARRIIFAGDSAGGGLVVATIVAAIQSGVPVPSGGILLSPWVDLNDTCTSDSWTRNIKYDYLPADLAVLFGESYRGDSNWEDVSAIHLPHLDKLPPLLIECGDSEVLMDQIMAFASKCISQGVSVDIHAREDMVHVFPLFSFTGMAQCNEAFVSMAAFVAKLVPVSGVGLTEEGVNAGAKLGKWPSDPDIALSNELSGESIALAPQRSFADSFGETEHLLDAEGSHIDSLP